MGPDAGQSNKNISQDLILNFFSSPYNNYSAQLMIK